MARKTYTEEEIQKRIDQLSEEAADFLYSPEMGVLVKQIADAHKLHIDQMTLLEAEVGELMLGLTESLEFVPNLIETLHIDKETADTIAKEVNEQLMQKMRGLMGAPSAQATQTHTSPQASSVMMPSSKPVIPTPVAAAPAPQAAPAPKAPVAAPTTAPLNTSGVGRTSLSEVVAKPAPELGAIDSMLSQKQVTTPASAAAAPSAATPPPSPAATPVIPAADPGQPQNYKADPYREPVE